MRNKINISIFVVLCVVMITLVGAPDLKAQGGFMQEVADTGLVHLERDELLIVSVSSRKGYQMWASRSDLEFESWSFGESNGFGGGPHVKISERTTTGEITRDQAFSYEVGGNTGGPGIYRVRVSCSRAPVCVVAASVHKIVAATGESRRKEYVGHITLIKQ